MRHLFVKAQRDDRNTAAEMKRLDPHLTQFAAMFVYDSSNDPKQGADGTFEILVFGNGYLLVKDALRRNGLETLREVVDP